MLFLSVRSLLSRSEVANLVRCPLVGYVETHPMKCDRVSLIQKSAEGASVPTLYLGGKY